GHRAWPRRSRPGLRPVQAIVTQGCRPAGPKWNRRSFVDMLRIFKDGLNIDPARLPFRVEALKKAAATPCMAGDAALLLHFQQNDVAVAIEADIGDPLAMARLLALAPEA